MKKKYRYKIYNMIYVSENAINTEDDKNSDNDTEIKKLRYQKLCRHYLTNVIQKEGKEIVKLTAAAYHQETRILVVGFSNGSFYLYEMPEVNMIHSLRYFLH